MDQNSDTMNIITEQRLSDSLKFLNEGSVLYVSGGECPALDSLVESSFKNLTIRFKSVGYRFVYLPVVFRTLKEDVLSYVFPGASGADYRTAEESILRLTQGSGHCSGFIRKSGGDAYFCGIPAQEPGLSAQEFVEAYLLMIQGDNRKNIVACKCVEPKKSKSNKSIELLDIPIGSLFAEGFDNSCSDEKRESPSAFRHPSKEVPETPLDPRTEKIITEIKRIQEQFGISIEELDVLLEYSVKLSRLHITPAGKIVLTDFGGVEVKLDDLSKAVFFLYLKHPEGISYFDIIDHREELMDLYMGITGKDDMEAIGNSIDSLCNRFDNSINVKVSRIKAAFKSVVSDRVAWHYYIQGPQGGTKRIAIDRDYVIWELHLRADFSESSIQ